MTGSCVGCSVAKSEGLERIVEAAAGAGEVLIYLIADAGTLFIFDES